MAAKRLQALSAGHVPLFDGEVLRARENRAVLGEEEAEEGFDGPLVATKRLHACQVDEGPGAHCAIVRCAEQNVCRPFFTRFITQNN